MTTSQEEIIEEFTHLFNETDWQEMQGDKLVDIDPEKWLRKALTQVSKESEQRGREEGIDKVESVVTEHLEKHGFMNSSNEIYDLITQARKN